MDYLPILSGQRRDPLAIFVRGLLWPLQWPYRLLIALRNQRYDRCSQATVRCDVPVISVGNLTTGGTGKTPLVRYVARLLRQHHLRVALLSRGYGAQPGSENDEALELAASLPDVPHLQDPDRTASAKIAVDELASQVLVLDDGFQHRRLARDLDIVAIDATNPWGYGHLLPRGLLREPLRSLRRAGAVVLTRADQVPPQQRQAIIDTVRRWAPQLVIAQASHQPTELLRWQQPPLPLTQLQNQSVAVLSGIGNPAAFEQTVVACGGKPILSIRLPDHAAYDSQQMAEIRNRLQTASKPISLVVCTHKDLVKLQTDAIAGLPLLALSVQLRLLDGEQELEQRILAAVSS